MFSGGAMFGDSQGFSFGATQGATQPDVSTQGGSAKKPRQEVAETCLPVTIRAVEVALDARGETGADLKFYGVAEPSMVIVVAAVESVVRQAASFEVVLNDATGRIKGRFFVTDQKSEELDKVVPGCYVSVFGEVRSAPARHLALKGVRCVESADEVSYHMIEAAHAMLHLQKSRGGGSETPMVAVAKGAASEGHLDHAAAVQAADRTPQKQGASPSEVTPVMQVPVKAEAARGPLAGAELRAVILDLLRNDSDGPEGLHLDAILQKLGAEGAEIKLLLTELVDEGEIFNTTTDEHFTAV